MSLKDTYGFTVDVENFVRILLNDPTTQEMVYSAIRKGAMPHTTPLGAANMKESKGDPDAWYTSFLATSNQVEAGQEGFVLRNSQGEGPRVSVRLKRQTAKTHTAVTQTPGAVLPEAASPEKDLLQRALSGDPVAAQALLDMAAAAAEPEVKIKL